MLEISQTTTLLQLFCELLLYSKVILKSMRVADDTIYMISECEWAKGSIGAGGLMSCTYWHVRHIICGHADLKVIIQWKLGVNWTCFRMVIWSLLCQYKWRHHVQTLHTILGTRDWIIALFTWTTSISSIVS